jgi:hypothetical protein
MQDSLIELSKMLQTFGAKESTALDEYEDYPETKGIYAKLHPEAQRLVKNGGSKHAGINPDAHQDGEYLAALSATHAKQHESAKHMQAHKAASLAIVQIGANGVGPGGGFNSAQGLKALKAHKTLEKALHSVGEHEHAATIKSASKDKYSDWQDYG